MMISANTAAANPLRDAALPVPQPAKNTGLASETTLVASVQEKPEVAPARAHSALAEINQTLQMASIGVRFEFDKEADTMIARVVDVESGEVIRQIPSEEVMRISKALDKLPGLLLRQTA